MQQLSGIINNDKTIAQIIDRELQFDGDKIVSNVVSDINKEIMIKSTDEIIDILNEIENIAKEKAYDIY